MPNWTKEQLRAINETGTNIIVSAGAGSGKTAVLTERVITKLKSGVNIQNLLILTFTNAAASEMKDRIRSSIKSIEELKEQLDYLDTAYITTFDSFSMSLVKKYHYILNVSPSIKIVDKSICDNIRNEILDIIFLEKYESKDEKFLKLITDLCVKDDVNIKKSILNINDNLSKLIDKDDYLNEYIDKYYNETNIASLINQYNDILILKLNKIKTLSEQLFDYCEEKYYNEISDNLINLLNSKNYDEIKNNINIKLPNVPRNSCEELKKIKSKITDEMKSLKLSLIYKDQNHIKQTIKSTQVYAESIIDILLELDERMYNYKIANDEYEFNDIACMAIKLVKENDDIKKEISESFTEIMVDEYQDTSDIQEELISLISNNNIYMVGDIKQSIYRFRNANPDIFKNKYNKYANNENGIKIDLLNNFRSREEVLNNINDIFNEVMSPNFGGADYKDSHQMNFGNQIYSLNNPNQNKNIEILNYKREDKKYSNGEYEAFIIANDIKNKIENNFQVLDKETKQLRTANYGDFCILIDRKTNFDLYKKVFEYLGIPLVIYYDEKITNEKDVLIIKNIIDMIIKIYNHENFEYDFYSILRSYLFNYEDQEFLDYYNNKNYKDSEIYKICESISIHLDELSNSELIEEIIEKFNFYEKVITVGEMEKFIVRIDYLKSLGDSLSHLGYSPLDFNNYLKNMVVNDSNIALSIGTKIANNVQLMNIHKSKGLEFPICYFAGYTHKFNKMDLNELFSFDKDIGFILPFYEFGIGHTITEYLYKNKYVEEDISERIRLFYVSLTRAKEKIIIVAPLFSDECVLNDTTKLEYNSFLSIIESIKDKFKDKIINVEVNLTKAYNVNKEKNISVDLIKEAINVHEISNSNIVEVDNASKHVNEIVDHSLLEYGIKVHKLFEVSDLLTSDNEVIKKFREKVDISNCKIYKEYEFITHIDNKQYHGIIDLILEYTDHINIIDYKLKNISDDNYIKQLNIYKTFIQNKLNKSTNIYLYSIIDNKLKEVK